MSNAPTLIISEQAVAYNWGAQRWPGWSAQGSATDKWIVRRLLP